MKTYDTANKYCANEKNGEIRLNWTEDVQSVRNYYEQSTVITLRNGKEFLLIGRWDIEGNRI